MEFELQKLKETKRESSRDGEKEGKEKWKIFNLLPKKMEESANWAENLMGLWFHSWAYFNKCGLLAEEKETATQGMTSEATTQGEAGISLSITVQNSN